MRTLHDAIEHCVRLNDSGVDAIVNEATTLDNRLRQQQMALRDGPFVDRAALDAAIAERDETRAALRRQHDAMAQLVREQNNIVVAVRALLSSKVRTRFDQGTILTLFALLSRMSLLTKKQS